MGVRWLLVLSIVAGGGCGETHRVSSTNGSNGNGGTGGTNGGRADLAGSDGGEVNTCADGDGDLVGCACDSANATRACFSGPDAARNIGACADGMQTCSSTGEFQSWDACAGQTLPVTEVCGNGIDDDCDGLTDCQDPDCATDAACQPDCQSGAIQPCYTGPAGTSGVGVCKPGTQSCDASGKWGACTGQVTPGSSESFLNGNCSDGKDNDCNGLKDCQELLCLLNTSCSPTVCTAGATQACYTGAEGTEGVGPCTGGTQTCASDGKSWGPCIGQVVPAPEGSACSDAIDNDCNGLTDCADPACATAANCCTPGSGTPVDETLWAHSPTDLYKVDPSTFALTHVGSFGTSDQITDIAVTPSGALWAISFTSLYTVDKTTAQATYVAAVSGSGNNGLTFLPNGNLLAADGSGAVKQINTSTGAVTAIGNFGNGLSSSGDLVAVGSIMYGISSTSAGGGDASTNNVLMRVDTSTGVATVVGPIGFGKVWGLAYVNKRVIAFNTSGQIIQIDPATGAGTLLSTTSVQFWGAGMSPNVPVNQCAP